MLDHLPNCLPEKVQMGETDTPKRHSTKLRLDPYPVAGAGVAVPLTWSMLLNQFDVVPVRVSATVFRRPNCTLRKCK